MEIETIIVRRQWSAWRKARFKLSDVSDFHWTRISGGVQAISPKPFLHAYVMCNEMISGELDHSGTHGPCPHQIKVCITKMDNTKDIFEKVGAAAR